MNRSFFRALIIRLALAVVTLWLLSLIAFACGALLPGNVGRAVLGPLADARAVAALNHQLGTDQPPLAQYAKWLSGLLHGDLGQSQVLNEPVSQLLGTALARSAALAGFALLLYVPLSVVLGVLSALRARRASDWFISIASMAFSVIPEFVWCITLILIFGVTLRWLPIFATTAPGASLGVVLIHLILPATALGLGLLGYLTRMVRASTLYELQEHYTRTAVLKGLPWHTVMLRHVLRNALQPMIAVIGTQLGYVIGGLVAVEALFRYPGIGSLILQAAKTRDFPLLQGGMLTVGIIYTIGTQCCEVIAIRLDPRYHGKQ